MDRLGTKGVIYARYSCEKQREESISGQIRECQEFARRNQITIVDIYKDEAMTATNANRPSFQRMIQASKTGTFDCIIVWKGDRFSRNRADASRYKQELKRAGVRLLSATEANMTGSQAILFDSLSEGMAEYYSVELGEKVVRGMTENCIEGKYNGGKLPFGFSLDENHHLKVNEDEAAYVRRMFDAYVKENLSVAELARKLEREGWVGREGKPIPEGTIYHLLSSEKYIGIYRFKETVNTNAFPAIVDRETFQAAQEKINKHSGGSFKTKGRSPFFLASKIFCGECGEKMFGDSATSAGGKVHYYYTCKNARKNKSCKLKHFSKVPLEKAVADLVLEFLLNDLYVEDVVRCIMLGQRTKNPDLERLEKSIADVDKKLNNLIDAIENGIGADKVKSRYDELEKMKADLMDQLEKLKRTCNEISEDAIRYYFKTITEIDTEDEFNRRYIIQKFVKKVVAYDDRHIDVFLNFFDGNEKIEDNSSVRTMTHSVHQCNNVRTPLIFTGKSVVVRFDIRSFLEEHKHETGSEW